MIGLDVREFSLPRNISERYNFTNQLVATRLTTKEENAKYEWTSWWLGIELYTIFDDILEIGVNSFF